MERPEQVSEILLTLLTLNWVDAELPVVLDVPVETLLDGELVLAEVPDSVPFSRTWCPTSFSSLKVSPCSG
jgi:hypothetical protein